VTSQGAPLVGEVDAVNLAEPAFGICSRSAGQEVGFDLVEAGSILGSMLIMGRI
jgi:hypothetical protein